MVEGLALRDLLPHPETDPTIHEGKATTIVDAPTESHALALEAASGNNPDHGTGRAQIAHGLEVLDLGWNEPKEHVESPLVGGLSNEEVWLLVRRFNKVEGTCIFIKRPHANLSVANVPCKRDTDSTTRWAGYEHCRRRGILA